MRKTAAVTTFNKKLYDSFAYRFMNTYNWNFDLSVYSEDKLDLDKGQFIDMNEIADCTAFVDRNKHKEVKRFNWDAVRFCYKVYAWADFILNRSDGYSGVIWIDSDSVFYKPIDQHWLEKNIHRDGTMMSYLGRPKSYYTETGFIYFNLEHPDTKDYVAECKRVYDSDDIYKMKQFHDCWVMDRTREKFEKERKMKTYNLGDGQSGHVQARSVLGKVYDHTKGKRKVTGRSPEFKEIR